MEYKGYRIEESKRHGKAGKGLKKTSSIQVIQELNDGNYLIKKHFSFSMTCYPRYKSNAEQKAKKWIDSNPISNDN